MFVYGPYEKNNIKGLTLYLVEWILITIFLTFAIFLIAEGELSLLASSILALVIALLYLFIKIVIKVVGEDKLSTPFAHRTIGVLVLVCSVAVVPFAFSGITYAAVDTLTGVAPFSIWAIITGIITAGAIVIFERKGTQLMKVFSPILGFIAGLAVAAVISTLGSGDESSTMLLIDFSVLDNIEVVSSAQPTIVGALKEIKHLSVFDMVIIAALALSIVFTIIELHNNEKLETGRRSTGLGMAARAICIALAAIITAAIFYLAPVAAILSAVPTCVTGGMVIGVMLMSIAIGFDSMTNKG